MRLIASRLGFDRVDLYVTPPTGSGLDPFSTTADDVAELDHPETDLERLPLIVGRRNVGLLVARGGRAPVTEAERRTLAAFGNQLALVLERDRLLRANADEQARRTAG